MPSVRSTSPLLPKSWQRWPVSASSAYSFAWSVAVRMRCAHPRRARQLIVGNAPAAELLVVLHIRVRIESPDLFTGFRFNRDRLCVGRTQKELVANLERCGFEIEFVSKS